MPRRRLHKPIHVVTLKTPTDWPLSKLVAGLQWSIGSLVFAYRVCDYQRKVKKDTVFVGLHNEDHYILLKNQAWLRIDGEQIEVSSIELKHGCSVLSAAQLNEAQPKLPFMMKIGAVKEVHIVTTIYLRDLLVTLEEQGEVTGAALMFDNKHKKSRKFGFAAFMHQEPVLALENKSLMVEGALINLKMSDSMPIIVSKDDAERYIKDKFVEWNTEIRLANWLVDDDDLEEVPVREPPALMEVDDEDDAISIDFNEGDYDDM